MNNIKDTIKDFMKSKSIELFGREPTLGECICCGEYVDLFDFEKEMEFDEYLVSYFCKQCQRKMFKGKI